MPKYAKRIRRRVESVLDSEAITGTATTLMARHIRRVCSRIDWTHVGRDDLAAEVRSGQPVIMALWHGRLAVAPNGWDPDWGRLCVVTSAARPGRMVGGVMQRFGLETMPMRDRKSNTATSLQVARMARDGVSMGFAVDGPEGPARIAKSVPIDWARLTGCPIWLYSNSVERYRILPKVWDNMFSPKPGGRGVMLYRKWEVEVPKRLDDSTRECLRQKLQDDLDALSLEADRMMGHPDRIN
ncbi:hypothetical protein CLV78_103174 [Aliiruegeria haliotis]|uniref:DUF374 domain-containing protein n=1 Tax=Aliiruegeria haliotis TaxID=1280846 RepID=A0A2T0RT16_9RHOB|nr:hypothetical protein CLV78_103174 [Aliiruegeria haliotis]